MVWGIAGQDPLDKVERFVKQMGLTYPVLYDAGQRVQRQYNPGRPPTNTAYPQDWLVGVDGKIRYVSRKYEAARLKAVIEAELAKAGK